MHLNGRVYDPLIGRMMAADPLVSNPSDGQAWNRYSYVGNDPLNLTDPTGYSWFSDFFNSIGSFLSSIIKAVIQIVVTAVLTFVLGPIGTAIGATWLTGALAAAGAAAVVTGLSGGNLGDMLKAAAVAGITAGLFHFAGDITGVLPGGHIDPVTGAHGIPDFGSAAHMFNIVSHGGIGCVSSVASGGDCASGAFAAGAASFAGPLIATQSRIGRLAINAAIGGTASVIAGGKFENGAVTAAFGYLYNELGTYRQRGYQEGPVKEFFGALGDFLGNYFDMRAANTIGADTYFHCRANCEATQRGPVAEEWARRISNIREDVDQMFGGSAADSARDQRANQLGRSLGVTSSQACSVSCRTLAPATLGPGPWRPQSPQSPQLPQPGGVP